MRPTVYRRRRFPTLYTLADIVLLARVDEANRQLAGPASFAILRREFELFRHPQFRRLAGLSVAHLHKVRRSRLYRQRLEKTRPTLGKLRIEFTKSRARRSNDNALVETKHGAIVRKWMGYQ